MVLLSSGRGVDPCGLRIFQSTRRGNFATEIVRGENQYLARNSLTCSADCRTALSSSSRSGLIVESGDADRAPEGNHAGVVRPDDQAAVLENAGNRLFDLEGRRRLGLRSREAVFDKEPEVVSAWRMSRELQF